MSFDINAFSEKFEQFNQDLIEEGEAPSKDLEEKIKRAAVQILDEFEELLQREYRSVRKGAMILRECQDFKENLNRLPSTCPIIPDLEPLKKKVTAAIAPIVKEDALLEEGAGDNREKALAVIKKNPRALKYVSKELRESEDFLLEAVKENSGAWEYVPLKFRNDSSFMLKSISINPAFLEYASDELKNDKEFLKQALKVSKEPFFFFPDEKQNDRAFLLEIIKIQPKVFNYFNHTFKEDKDFLLEAVQVEPSVFEFFEEAFQLDRQFVLEAVKKNGRVFEYVPQSLRGFHSLEDEELALAAIQQNAEVFATVDFVYQLPEDFFFKALCVNAQVFPIQYRNSKLVPLGILKCIEVNPEVIKYTNLTGFKEDKEQKDFFLQCISKNPKSFLYIPDRFQKDRAFLLDAIQTNAEVFVYIPGDLQNDEEFVFEGVQRNGKVLKFSSSFQNNERIVLAAVIQNGLALEDAPDAFKMRKEFVLAAVGQNGLAFQYAALPLQQDAEMVLEAIAKNAEAVLYAHPDVLKDKRVALATVSQFGHLLEKFPAFQNDIEVVLTALRQNGLALKLVPDAFKAKREVVLAAVRQNGHALEHAPRNFREDEEVVVDAVTQNPDAIIWALPRALGMQKVALATVTGNGILLSYFEAFQNDIEVVLTAIRQNGLALKLVPDAFKAKREVVLAAVEQNGMALEFAPEVFTADKAIALAAIRQDPIAIQFIGRTLVDDLSFKLEVIPLLLPRELSTIDGILYKIEPMPKAFEGKLEMIPEERRGSWPHLLEDLSQFLDTLKFESRPASLKGCNTPDAFQEQIGALKETLNSFKERLTGNLPFLGTPKAEDTAALKAFYDVIKSYLDGIDGWCNENPFVEGNPKNREERLQILEAAGVCGGGFLGQLQQLFSQLCLHNQNLPELLATRVSMQAERSIEAFVQRKGDSNVHTKNILLWQLSAFTGRPVPKDPLMDPFDEFDLMKEFLNLHTVARLVMDLYADLKADEGLQKKVSEYTVSSEFLSYYAEKNGLKASSNIEEEIETILASINRENLRKVFPLLYSLPAKKSKEVLATLARSGPLEIIKRSLPEDLTEEQKNTLLEEREIFQRLGALTRFTGLSLEQNLQQVLREAKNELVDAAKKRDLKEQADEDFTQKHKDETGGLKPSAVALVFESFGFIHSVE